MNTKCEICGVEDPKTIYGDSALSKCCEKIMCDECLMEHSSKHHPKQSLYDNPDMKNRIDKWLS